MAATNINTLKKRMISALEDSLGIVSTACKVVGICRQTHYKWLKNDAKYKEKCEDVAEMAIDTVESHLYKMIKKGDTACTIFYMKTKGKKRGYIERTETDITTGGDKINNTFQVEILPSNHDTSSSDELISPKGE